MKYWFTSDTHFGHKKILKYSGRPFSDIREHDEALIDNWNSVVSPQDTVYHLGDFAFLKPEEASELVQRLNGQKYLIFGNHDRRHSIIDKYFKAGNDYMKIKISDKDAHNGKQRIILFHYPIEQWDQKHYGSWHLHGHSHNKVPSAEHILRLDVGVDNHGYYPVSYEQIKEHMKRKTFVPLG